MCNVPKVIGKTLAATKKLLASADCRAGKVSYARSKLARGLVSSEKPRAGSVLPRGAKVDLVVSKGRK
jgi:eukaryotic-like serine/threonine-protein kinase